MADRSKHRGYVVKKPAMIWSTNALPLVPARFKGIYTVLIPSIDVGVILFAVVSLVIGSRIVSDGTLPWFPYVWASITLLGGALALFGLSTLHDYVELAGRVAVIIGLGVYLAATVIYIVNDNPSAVLTFILTMLRLMGTIWRINDLITDIARKKSVPNE